MKQYVIDELRPADLEKVREYLSVHFLKSRMEGLYWIPLSAELLTPVQSGHTKCHPHVFSVEVEPTGRLSCELLVRTCNRVRCDCIGYATKRQRDWLIDRMEQMLDALQITV
jgi:hypothetical protein